MTQYDITIVSPRDREDLEHESAAPPRRKLDWERALREAAEAELSIQCAD